MPVLPPEKRPKPLSERSDEEWHITGLARFAGAIMTRAKPVIAAK